MNFIKKKVGEESKKGCQCSCCGTEPDEKNGCCGVEQSEDSCCGSATVENDSCC
ncbi:MAG TPA: hypothetical protein VEF53_08755 [Patescibacteria group bacterium]|nr:hypothetical protein [Patescibacteria group bacterium]